MFVMYEKENMKVPVKVWLEKNEDLESTCREQLAMIRRIRSCVWMPLA